MRRILGPCFGMLLALGGREPRAPGRFALLVGIERYPLAFTGPALEGPAHDVAAMHDVLVTRFGFGSGDVEELHDAAATHEAIAAGFARLIDRAGPGDLILFYFAGLGSRLPDDDADAGSDGWDETLVPYDAGPGESGENDIRDDEIARWIARANLKTDQVVLVFDCSSSDPDLPGEAPGRARCLRPAARRAPLVETAPAATVPGAGGSMLVPFATQTGSGWVPPHARCVALSACRAQEAAFEVRVEATGRPSESGPAKGAAGLCRGLFTMSLIEELSSVDSDASWAGLMLRVSARVAARTPRQTPVIEGTLAGCGLFREIAPARAPRFEADLAETGRLRVHAGLLEGLAPGAVLAACSKEAPQDDPELRLGELEIVEAGVRESVGRWRRGPPAAHADAAPRTGPCTLFLLQSGPMRAPLPVSVEGDAATALAPSLETTRLVRCVAPAESRYRITTAGAADDRIPRWTILDADGRALAQVAADGPEGIRRLVEATATLARSWRAQELLRSPVASGFPATLAVRLLGERREDGSRPDLDEPEKDARGRFRIPAGTPWSAAVSTPSDVQLRASFVLVFPDGRIAVPRSSGAADRIEPGAIVIPAGSEAFFAEEPVRLYCILSPRRRDLSAFAQDGFPGEQGAPGWSASELADETWACVSAEIAVR